MPSALSPTRSAPAHKPATKYQKTENRSQKTVIPDSNRPTQRAMPYALCPMPIISYHSFSPSQLLTFPPSWLVPQPATRNQIPEDREQKSEDGRQRTEIRRQRTEVRRQRTEIRRQIFRIQIVLLNAPCPMPIISYHSFSPSQLLTFSPSHLPGLSRTPQLVYFPC